MKKEITIRIKTDKDNEMIKEFICYYLNLFNINKENIEIKNLKEQEK